MGSRTINQMFKLQEKIKELQDQCDSLGESMLGPTYDGCFISGGYITLFEDCGHEFESDEYLFDSEGNLL